MGLLFILLELGLRLILTIYPLSQVVDFLFEYFFIFHLEVTLNTIVFPLLFLKEAFVKPGNKIQ